jgi:hypothetical protein
VLYHLDLDGAIRPSISDLRLSAAPSARRERWAQLREFSRRCCSLDSVTRKSIFGPRERSLRVSFSPDWILYEKIHVFLFSAKVERVSLSRARIPQISDAVRFPFRFRTMGTVVLELKPLLKILDETHRDLDSLVNFLTTDEFSVRVRRGALTHAQRPRPSLAPRRLSFDSKDGLRYVHGGRATRAGARLSATRYTHPHVHSEDL